MLNLKEKIDYFEKYLEKKDNSYYDKMKDEIYLHFFELYGNKNDTDGFLFLNEMQTKKDIEQYTDFLISKMIMNEHISGLDDIIYEYGY